MNQLTNVRQIKAAIDRQTYQGRGRVYIEGCNRVVGVRTVKGQLQARVLGTDKWT
jgi:hypothetical protein